MSIKNIELKLNKIIADKTSNERILIFWYDDKGTYAEEISTLQLNDAQIFVLDRNNGFEAKYTLCRKNPSVNYLIYAPYPKPSDSDEFNFMLDLQIETGNVMFYADAMADLCGELGIDLEYKVLLEKQQNFWKKKSNINKFKKLGITSLNDASITLGVMAVICNQTTAKLDEIVKCLIFSGNTSDSNEYLMAFKEAEVYEDFWSNCASEYDFQGNCENISQLILTFIYSYIDGCHEDITAKYPDRTGFKLSNSANVFMANLLTNSNLKDKVNELLHKASMVMGFSDILKDSAVEDYYECDIFEEIDVAIIANLSNILVATGRSLTDNEKEVIRERYTTMHFFEDYQHDYKALKYADLLLQAVLRFLREIEEKVTAEALYGAYTTDWYNIDVYYRKFYSHYDQCHEETALCILKDKVENAYVDDFWNKLGAKWSSQVKCAADYSSLPGDKQETFYTKYLAPKQGDMVAVIISDALRYEVGKELVNHMNDNANMSPTIKPMYASIPTVTAVGMAALLPHGKMEFAETDKGFNVLLDGKTTIGTPARESILRNDESDAIAVQAQDIQNMGHEDIREAFKNKKTFYIYHNTIDNAGEHNEAGLVKAADEAISEIMKLIAKLAQRKSITKFIVTADHGFIYRRSKLVQADKIAFPKGNIVATDKRYMIANRKEDVLGTVAMPLENYHEGWYLHVPYGYDVFSTQGGGMQYQHGGMSLQELIIPVIEVSYNKYKVDKNKVKVELYTASRKISEFMSYLDFLQDEKVSDVKLERTVKCWLEDSNKEIISNIVTIVADRRADNVNDRIYHEKFILPKRKYSQDDEYYLIIAEGEETLYRYPMTIDVWYRGLEI